MNKLTVGTTTEQKQTLKLSPVQMQSIEILQMNSAELEQRIQDELMENPVLEVAEKVRDGDDDSFYDQHSESIHEELTQDELPYYDHFDDHDFWDGHSSRGSKRSSGGDASGIESFENFYRRDETLYDHLIAQLGGLRLSDDMRSACEYIILSLRDDGYLDHSAGDIANASGHSIEAINEALRLVRSMDPAGVAAYTLEDCLCMQLSSDDELSEDAAKVIRSHLKLVASGQAAAIASAIGIPASRAAAVITLIRSLDPRPASRFFDGQPQHYITPDVIAEAAGDIVSIYLAGTQTDLRLSSYYSDMVRSSKDPEVQTYLKERIGKAELLIQSIEQRRSTIIKVTGAILRHQSQFLRQGNLMLLPLTMQEIADELEISVSTVSRAVSGKYLKCPSGTFELKHFFTAEVAGTSRDAILDRIKSLIDSEDKAHPLSDQKIADKLSAEGLDVSRRTVAKYRDNAGILPTSMRKERR